MAPNQKIAVWLKGTAVGKKGAFIFGRGAAAACADGLWEYQRLFQREEVTDSMMPKMKIVVASGNQALLLALGDLGRRKETIFWTLYNVCLPVLQLTGRVIRNEPTTTCRRVSIWVKQTLLITIILYKA